MNSDGIQKITLNDIYAKGNGDLSYAADNFGRHISDTSSFFRGLKFDYKGKIFSAYGAWNPDGQHKNTFKV